MATLLAETSVIADQKPQSTQFYLLLAESPYFSKKYGVKMALNQKSVFSRADPITALAEKKGLTICYAKTVVR